MPSPTPPIKVLFTGPVTILSDAGANRKVYRVLAHDDLAWVARQRSGDIDISVAEQRERVVRAAVRDGLILCVRPEGWRDGAEARVGLSLQEALDHSAINGLPGMIAVHPYDEDGEPIMTADGEPLTKWAAK